MGKKSTERLMTLPELAEMLGVPIETLYGAMPEKYKAMVLVGAYAGLRWGEAAGLTRASIDVLRSRIPGASTAVEVCGHLTVGHEPKTSRSKRTVPVARSVIRRLEEHLANFVGAESDALVFTAPRGDPLARSLFSRRVWQPAVIRAGIPSITFHGLRHSFVAILVAAGCNVREVSEWAGHNSVAFTLTRYGGLFEDGSESGCRPAGRAAGRRLEGLRQRALTGHAETDVSPERVPEPILRLGQANRSTSKTHLG